MFSIPSKNTGWRATTMASRRPSVVCGRRGGENDTRFIGCGMGPEGAFQRESPADSRQSRTAASSCLKNPRDGVGDQIRYLRLRVALLLCGVNVATQRNREKVASPGTRRAQNVL